MTRARASFVRSAFTLLFGALVALAAPAAYAGTGNDAALVMDAETGRVLYARSADASRAPASLTKMMTLYVLFDMLKSGRIQMTDEMTASANAAAQKPTKLGLKKGDTITVEQAIYALAIVSANDVAVVVAEHIGGTEAKFAQMMTKRARELGMKRTTFRNPSGLPDDEKQAYRDALIDRFNNPQMKDQLARIAMDGTQKLPIRIVPHVNAFAGRGEVAKGATRAIAGWVLHLRGVGAPVDDKASVELVKQANAGDLVAAVQAVLDYLLVDDALVAESVLAQAEEMLGMRP